MSERLSKAQPETLFNVGEHKELEPKPSEVVRVLINTVARPDETAIEQIIRGNDIWFTRTYWIAKSSDPSNPAVNPDQVMLPGGKLNKGEDTHKAADRETLEELGIPINEKNKIGHRTYRFDHPRRGQVKNDETILSAVAPPFIHPTTYNQEDKVEVTLKLTPAETTSLIKTEKLSRGNKNLILLDSLHNQTSANVNLTLEEQVQTTEIKDNILQDTYEYELRTRKQVMQRLVLNNPSMPSEFKNELQTMHDSPINVSNIDALRQQIEDINSLFAKLIYENLETTSAEQLQTAFEEIYLENSLKFIKDAGPQKPYLAGQMLLDLTIITPHEFQLIGEYAPELHSYLDVVSKVFDIDLNAENGYQNLMLGLTEMRDRKADTADASVPAESLIEYQQAVHSLQELFNRRFNVSNYAQVSLDSYNFLKYIPDIFRDVVDGDLLKKLRINSKYADTTSLEELTYLAFGLNQHRADTVDKSIRWHALKKIITIIETAQIYPEYYKAIGETVYPVRTALENISADHEASTKVVNYKDYSVTTLKLDSPLIVQTENGDMNISDVNVFFKSRIKDIVSYIRKNIERGGNGLRSISDIFGYEMILEPCLDGVEIDSLSQEAKNAVYKASVKEFMTKFLSKIKTRMELSNIKAEGYLSSVLQEAIELQSEETKELVYVEQQHEGSGASKADWNWLKFVITVAGVPCELQVFPDFMDFEGKKKDDPEFNLRRLLMVHKKGRYSPIDVFYNTEEVRDLITKKLHEMDISRKKKSS